METVFQSLTLEELKAKEQSLPHTTSRYVNHDSFGGAPPERLGYHLLTCEKCRLRTLLGLPKEEPDVSL